MDRQNDRSDSIICPMLCYSNGTDNDDDDDQNTAMTNAHRSVRLHDRASRR